MTPDNPVHEPKPAHRRPGPEVEIAEISQEVREAWWVSFMSGSSGSDPTPTAQQRPLGDVVEVRHYRRRWRGFGSACI